MTTSRNGSRLAGDATPQVGAATDIASLGRSGAPPPHERTAEQDPDILDWKQVAALEEFKALVRAKRRFIVPATIFFVVYYFALPALVGYARPVMEKPVWGVVNLAYLFALSQFFVAWILAALYMRAAGGFDALSQRIHDRLADQGKSPAANPKKRR